MEDEFALWLKTKRLLTNISDSALYERQNELLIVLGGMRGILEILLKSVNAIHPIILKQLSNTLKPKDTDDIIESSPMNNNYLLDLPDDIISKTCHYLSIFDLKNIQLTCLSLAIIARMQCSTHYAKLQLSSSTARSIVFPLLLSNKHKCHLLTIHNIDMEGKKILIDIGIIPYFSQILAMKDIDDKSFFNCKQNLDTIGNWFGINNPYFKKLTKHMIEYNVISNYYHSPHRNKRNWILSGFGTKYLTAFSRLSETRKKVIISILSNDEKLNCNGMQQFEQMLMSKDYNEPTLKQLFATGILFKIVEFSDSSNKKLKLMALNIMKYIIALPNDRYWNQAIWFGFIDVLQKLTTTDVKIDVDITGIVCKIITDIIKGNRVDSFFDKIWKPLGMLNMIDIALNVDNLKIIYIITDMFRSIMHDGPIWNEITDKHQSDIVSKLVILLNRISGLEQEETESIDLNFIIRSKINLIWCLSHLCKKKKISNDIQCQKIISLCIKHGFLNYTMNILRDGDIASKRKWNLQILNSCIYSVVMLVKNGGKHALWLKTTDFLQFIPKFMSHKGTAQQIVSILTHFCKLKDEAIECILQKSVIQSLFSIIIENGKYCKTEERQNMKDFTPTRCRNSHLLDVEQYKQKFKELDPTKKQKVELSTGKIAILHYMGTVTWAKTGQWFGVELTGDYFGLHDGKIKGVRYFTCPPKRGTFVKKIKGPIHIEKDDDNDEQKRNDDNNDNNLNDQSKITMLNSLLSPTLFCLCSIIENSNDKHKKILIEYGIVDILLVVLDKQQTILLYKTLSMIDILLKYSKNNEDCRDYMKPFIQKLKEMEMDQQRKNGVRSVVRRVLKSDPFV